MTKSSSYHVSDRTGLSVRGRARVLLSLLIGALLGPALATAASPTAPAGLSAAQIVEKFQAARGGAQAWRVAQTISVTGKLDAGTGDSIARSERMALGESASKRARREAAARQQQQSQAQVQLPFRLEMKRPHKSRLEIDVAGTTAVQVYDGQNGWKLRPYLNRNDAEPFSESEAKFEAERADLEGPLFDYAAKGTSVALEGVESVDGHSAYKLKLTLKSGDAQHIWIDTQSFLDVKVEGISRRMDGRTRSVWIYQRDFRSVQGLKVPFLYETAIEGSPGTHKMVVESVAVNRTLDDSRFAKPQVLAANAAAGPAAVLPVASPKPGAAN
jgi:outer membrane lipoprotein-sorting protein